MFQHGVSSTSASNRASDRRLAFILISKYMGFFRKTVLLAIYSPHISLKIWLGI